MIGSLLKQLKHRRLALKLRQSDMMMRVGMSRQQYQQLESKGNPRLDTLELVAKGLNSELVLIPKEKLSAVLSLLAKGETGGQPSDPALSNPNEDLSDDPWEGFFEDES